ncbi:hypothetical protein ACJ72_04414 [Emergomyces africanus]|uniref:Uncharacterized protein n=1 Tax=Emergomyces africanus TaxID=1955775 RepID=A0A1B7NWU5_9EURO|nr:hypothetical protein ACJ72_04414 [Emergomyces africanus]
MHTYINLSYPATLANKITVWHSIKQSEATNQKQVDLRRKAEQEEAERQKEQIRKELEEGS